MPFASEAIHEVFRLSPEEVREDASKLLANIHPDDYDGTVASIQKSAEDLSTWQHEFRVKFDDGTIRALYGNAVPQREEDGSVLWHGFITDVTDRKRAEEQALIFRRFAEASGQGLSMATLQGQILYMNQTLCRMLDEENLEDVYKKGFPEYYPPEFRERLLNEVLPTVISGGQWVGELSLVSTKGKQTPTIENFFLIRDEEGRPLRLADVVTDITERKQMEDDLRKAKDAAECANRAKSEFLANMSHEIRTPMTAILGYADLMLDENVGRTTREHVAVIKRNGEHLLQVIGDILDLSKIEAGKLQIEPTRCSPVQLVAEVVSLMRPQAAAKQLEAEDGTGPPPAGNRVDRPLAPAAGTGQSGGQRDQVHRPRRSPPRRPA